MLFHRHARLTPASRAAVADRLRDPTFELVPLKNVMDQVAHVPPGSTVSVTASPAKGLEATAQLATHLQADGFQAVPHPSARMVRDRAHLVDLVAVGSRDSRTTRSSGHGTAWTSTLKSNRSRSGPESRP